MNKKILIIVATIVFAAGVGCIWFAVKNNQERTAAQTPIPSAQAGRIEYANNQYGFSFTLPQDWEGYSIVTSTWEGAPAGSASSGEKEAGPVIAIRNPKWTAQNPYQDIPIMIFTLVQWDSLLRDMFHIGAAPINPSRLGFNARYVFALPARYNFAFPAGYEEVERILQDTPLHSLPVFGALSVDGKILLCGGIPNGSTQQVTETTRLFINLPKDIYPDKEHNLQFTTVRGNATVSWISNAGPYGEAFQSTPECWSYYYEFDGTGKVDVAARAGSGSVSDYLVHFSIDASR